MEVEHFGGGERACEPVRQEPRPTDCQRRSIYRMWWPQHPTLRPRPGVFYPETFFPVKRQRVFFFETEDVVWAAEFRLASHVHVGAASDTQYSGSCESEVGLGRGERVFMNFTRAWVRVSICPHNLKTLRGFCTDRKVNCYEQSTTQQTQHVRGAPRCAA